MSTKKRILFVITKSNWGGAQKNVFDIAASLPKEAYDVSVVFGGNSILSQKLQNEGISAISINSMQRDISLLKEISSFIKLFSIIKSESPNILHLHSPKAGGLGALCGRLLGVEKIIYTVHGWAFNEDRPWWQKSTIRFFSWITMLLCHTVITINNKETDQAKRFPFCAKKIVFLPNGFNVPDYYSKEEARDVLSKKIEVDFNEKFVIGTIAELHKNKGYSYAISAFKDVVAKHPTALYIIIGIGEERNSLQEMVNTCNLQKNVFFVGHVDDAAKLIKSFDLFLLPSIKEGLPYVLLEAGAAAVPCVATAVGGIPDLITNRENGILIKPNSSEAITKSLLHAIEHHEKTANYANQLSQKIKKDFTVEKMMRSLEELYRS